MTEPWSSVDADFGRWCLRLQALLTSVKTVISPKIESLSCSIFRWLHFSTTIFAEKSPRKNGVQEKRQKWQFFQISRGFQRALVDGTCIVSKLWCMFQNQNLTYFRFAELYLSSDAQGTSYYRFLDKNEIWQRLFKMAALAAKIEGSKVQIRT